MEFRIPWTLSFYPKNEEFSMKSAMITTVRDPEDVCYPFAAINAVPPIIAVFLISLRAPPVA